MSNSDAFLAHVIFRMQADIDFLVAHGVISATDGQVMSGKLPSAQQMPTPMASPSPTPVTNVAPPVRREWPPASPAPTLTPAAPPVRRGEPPVLPYSQMPHAKALWSYNENGQEAGDLSFNAGETIEILEETNADWWKGKNSRGETGLFPSNYVQKVAPVPTAPSAFLGGRMVAPIPSEKASYSPIPVATPEPQAQEAQPPKKKFGKFGNRMAQAAAGGVGFGAGAAVGGGIVNAIF